MNAIRRAGDTAHATQLAQRFAGFHSPVLAPSSTYEVLTQLEVAKVGADSAQQLRLWTAQICGGLAIGLFPYTPGLVQSCNPHHNPGWLCAARTATFIAASGATLIGVLSGVALVRSRRWVLGHASELAVVLGNSADAPKAAVRAALSDYLALSAADRRHVRDLCRPSSQELSA